MSKYTRKQKRPEDEFVGFWQRFFQKVEPYARAIGITTAVAVGLVAIVWGVSSWLARKSQAATEAFARVVRIYDEPLVDEGPAAPKSDEESPIPRYKTDKERAGAALAELDAFDKRYGGSEIAREATLFRAGVLYDLGRWDDARRSYDEVLRDPHAAPLTAVAREGLGLSYEAEGKLDDALAAYQALEPKTGDYFRDRALWDQARVLQKKGDKKKAAEKLKELVSKVPGSPMKDEAQTRIAVLEGT